MSASLAYLRAAVGSVLKLQGVDDAGQPFVGGLTASMPFRPTQHEAMVAYDAFLNSDESDQHKKTGYFELPTGIGKTGIFISLIREAHHAAKKDAQEFHSMIVVPTTQLLSQTYDEFLEIAPGMKHDIGLYGDGHKTLNKPVTLITYDSWIALTEQGKINHTNVDLLVSDEAHRGTSERRVDQLFQAFGNGTVQLAFTATAHFDEEKSVQATHKNEIFYKSLPDSIRAGELAAYVHSQLYVIRVAPLEKDDPRRKDADSVNGMRRQAWNQRIMTIFANGTDHVTGDPLSDNQAGFFVSDTAHADRLEQMINKDATLTAKAKALGKKGVAVAIHSNLPPREQKQRLKDYLDGKYMAVIGDEKFKEGFNYPPMKNIFDYPRGSLVDKAQIAGRAGRKWWNDAKDRYEGMSFIDTIVYVGSDDRDEDELRREQALRRAVLISTVLDGTEVFAEKFELAQETADRKKNTQNAVRPKLFSGDENVEEYATLEEVKDIHALIKQIRRKDVIELTDEKRLWLNQQVKRTGFGATRIVTGLGETCPEDLNFKVISNWQRGGTSNARILHWNLVKNFLEVQPDTKPVQTITENDRIWINTQIERTGLAAHAIINKLGNDAPEGLTVGVIIGWRTGTIKTMRIDHWNAVQDMLVEQPDAKPTREISEEERIWLNEQMDRTRLGIIAIRNGLAEGKADDLHASTIQHWRAGFVRSAQITHWEAVKEFLAVQPDAKPIRNISDADIAELNKELDRTKFGKRSILTGLGDKKPEGLTSSIIEAWRITRSSFARIDHWDAVIGFLKAQKTAGATRELSEAERLAFNKQIERTGIGCAMICTMLGDKIPENLTKSKLESWSKGSVRTVQIDHWNAVKAFLEAQPDAKPTRTIADQDIEKLEKEAARTGFLSVAIVSALGADAPAGLTKHIIQSWRKKTSRAAQVDHWDAVMGFLLKQPDAKPMRNLSSEDVVALKGEMARTGMRSTAIVKALGSNLPDKLTVGMMESWLNGTSRTVRVDHWDAVMNLCRHYEIIDAKRVGRLQKLQDSNGVNIAEAFSQSGQPVPSRLSKHILLGIFNGNTVSLHKDDLQAIEQVYAALTPTG